MELKNYHYLGVENNRMTLPNLSEKMEKDKRIIETPKLERIEKTNSSFRLIDNVIQDFAPEISCLYQYREDEAEEQQIKTGLLHENRILGIILKFYLEGQKKVSTTEVEEEYGRYFKNVARSTISTYLNMLNKESILYKERNGRIVYYIFSEEPPKGINPFWFTRTFCTAPAYFSRATFFSWLYSEAEKHVEQSIEEYGNGDNNIDILFQNFKLITGIIILNIFRNRISKCMLCQFSKKENYCNLREIIQNAIKDRSDVLSQEMLSSLIKKCSEIPMFGGINIKGNNIKKDLVKEIVRSVINYKQDLEFQRMLFLRRQELRLKQKRG
ncbi:MAG: hypothetical protein HWN81_13625, partial [Candidatus Lokiarchaeota archaeon]|nr:hypothetical protein [Candidatus Lokiarchaeota archaeon]